MSKGNVILGYARGSIGDVTLARVKGQQIARARNRNPKNPKSPAQMTQRIKFAPVTKFYQQGKSGLLPFSFANKKPLESDFNAFMRENLTAITPIYPTKEELNSRGMWLPNTFVVADGKLAAVGAGIISGTSEEEIYGMELPADASTTKSWSSFLAKYPQFTIGSIVTAVIIEYNCQVVGNAVTPRNGTPSVKIAQFTVGEEIATSLTALMEANGFTIAIDASESSYICMGSTEGPAAGFLWYHSKESEGKTEETFTQVWLNAAAETVVAELSAEDHLGRALVSWGASDAAILQGSLSGDVR